MLVRLPYFSQVLDSGFIRGSSATMSKVNFEKCVGKFVDLAMFYFSNSICYFSIDSILFEPKID